VGGIRLVEPTASTIDPSVEILGQVNYKSPNGVAFTNGLKVRFDGSAPEAWRNDNYYVEGVGTAITLIPESELISIESINSSYVVEPGAGYVVGDRLTLIGGTSTAQATAVVNSITEDTATATATINTTTGEVSAIAIVNGGSGYLATPTVTVSSAPAGYNNAYAHAVVTNGVVTSIVIDSVGDGYIGPPTITIEPTNVWSY